MELSKTETIALLVSNKEETVTGPIFIKSQSQHDWNLSLKVGDKQHAWDFNQCVKADLQGNLTEKYQELINLAMNGYNAAALYLSIGSLYLYENRHQSHEAILSQLKDTIASAKNPIHIEYVYMCVTDDECYDCRKDKWHSASSVFEAGLDSFMKEVSSIDDIWKKVKTGCKLPFVLKILLHDKVTKRHGHLLIIDLLHPKFFTDITSKIHYSFISLRNVIDTITTRDHHGRIALEPHLLVSILAEYISGRSKLTVFTYLNEYPQKEYDEVIAVLDLVRSLKDIPCISLPLKESPRTARETEELKNQVELLKEQIADLQYRNSKLAAKHSASLNALEEFSKVRKTEMQREELLQSLKTISMEEELRKTRIGLVNSVATANIKEFQRHDFEHENKRLKLDVLSNTHIAEEYGYRIQQYETQLDDYKLQLDTYKSQIEKYKLQLRNCKEQIGDYEDKVEKLQKANIQVSKGI
ncbi:hypothetical protein RMATCC62417_17803 [Rhizopus microsporus]|nr:hypothetical protein RMATCC62417_17803 [Rhizopus microsporus]